MRLDDLAATFVGNTDHRAFRNIGVSQQRRLDLGAGDIVAGGNDHVVRTGRKMEAAVFVLEK